MLKHIGYIEWNSAGAVQSRSGDCFAATPVDDDGTGDFTVNLANEAVPNTKLVPVVVHYGAGARVVTATRSATVTELDVNLYDTGGAAADPVTAVGVHLFKLSP